MGDYKGLNEGCEVYRIPNYICEEIGQETIDSMPYLPSAFGRKPLNIHTSRGLFTAEVWSFWFMYLAPHLLANRFQDEKYVGFD